jgi:ABC-type uncharacterized transport system permease subunit
MGQCNFLCNSCANRGFQYIVLSARLFPAVNLRIMRNNTLRHATLLALCALVFMFAFHAKTAVYNGGAPANLTSATAAKLWLSGQKMEVRPIDSSTVALFWMAVVCLFGLFLHREPRVQSVLITPSPRNLTLQYVQRFLRPPPVQG